ncbi:cysteine desulfurase family protein [Euzebya tangerina]|uniref:cysteine desulfurase family protein n=1 Tax=Euzebya tangerina TaxID=591198 RepID=UPI00196A9CE6|nr:cysteine desulfurase family protein [Euzebya tangerina]
MKSQDEIIYLDHAATSPVAPEVTEVMLPWLRAGSVGNASSLHSLGRRARAAVEDARDQVAAALGITPLEVLFTSGGTEADNQAIKGLVWAAREAGRGTAIVTSAIEHPAVLEACEWLRDVEGHRLDIVGVGTDGRVDPEEMLEAVGPDTAVVSLMTANNELGTVQPVDLIGPALAERGVSFHSDTVQAFGKIPLDLHGWGITAAALSAHKFNGPTGVGVMTLRRDVDPHPVLHGGRQERGVRSGTLNVAGIVGLGAAAELARGRLADEGIRLTTLRDRLIEALTTLDGVTLNGHPTERLPNNVHVAVTGADAEATLLALDRAGIACSTGSACQSGAAQRSHVLDAVEAATDAAHLRFSLGLGTTEAHIDRCVAELTRLLVPATAGAI